MLSRHCEERPRIRRGSDEAISSKTSKSTSLSGPLVAAPQQHHLLRMDSLDDAMHHFRHKSVVNLQRKHGQAL